MKCYFCDTEYLEASFNEEHIIPQAIGGTLKNDRIICRHCNERYGRSIDRELTENFRFIATTLGVHRDRRKHSTITLSSQNDEDIFRYFPDKGLIRNSDFKKIDEKTYLVYGKNEEEIKKNIEKLEKRKNKKAILSRNLDIPDEERGLFYKFELYSGNKNVLCSIYKSALLYYLHTNNDPLLPGKRFSYCDKVLAGNLISLYAKKNNFIPPITVGEIYHSIVLFFNKDLNSVIAQINIFSCFQYVAILASPYFGDNYSIGYLQNVFTGKIQKITPECELKKGFNLDNRTSEEFRMLMEPLSKIMHRKYSESMIGKSLSYDFCGIPKGTIIDEKLVELIYQETCKDLGSESETL